MDSGVGWQPFAGIHLRAEERGAAQYPHAYKLKSFLIFEKFISLWRGAAPHPAGGGLSRALPQTPPAPGLRPWTPKKVPVTPPTTRLSAQTVGGGSGPVAASNATSLPVAARKVGEGASTADIGPGDSLAVIPAKGFKPAPESIF